MKRMVVFFSLVLAVVFIGMGTSAFTGNSSGSQDYICGDADNSGVVDNMDIAYIMDYVFSGGPEPMPLEAADVNRDGKINAGDAVYLANYLYKGGPDPVCAGLDHKIPS